MTSFDQVSEAAYPEKVFTHSGISYKSKTLEVLFSAEAKEELVTLIKELQEGIVLDDKTEPVSGLTTEVWQAVLDAMISKWKWKQKVEKFMKRFSKAIKAPEKMSEKEEQKVTKKVEKYSHDPYIHVYIVLESGERLAIPLIIRKESSTEHILHSFFARNKVSHFH
jgi:hypothetical protein